MIEDAPNSTLDWSVDSLVSVDWCGEGGMKSRRARSTRKILEEGNYCDTGSSPNGECCVDTRRPVNCFVDIFSNLA
jgi:hypothetical protein